jgi:anti-sigma B factor antagonist
LVLVSGLQKPGTKRLPTGQSTAREIRSTAIGAGGWSAIANGRSAFRLQGVVSVELDGFQATSKRLDDGTFVVSVAGELDLYTVPALERALLSAEDGGAIVVELSECTFIDSTALGILLAAKRRLGIAGPRLSIVAPSPEVRQPFELTGVDREFAFHPCLASALNGGAA